MSMLPDETSTFESYDKFRRKDCAEFLTTTVEQLNEPSVIMLDGAWGTGKTVFLRLWANSIKDSFPVIYIDAFKRDYSTDPLYVLSSEILLALENANVSPKEKTNFLATAAKFAKTLAPAMSVVAIKVATAGLIGRQEGDQITDAFTQSVSDEVVAGIRTTIEEGAKYDKAVNELKKSMIELPKLLQNGVPEENLKPLIIIVDELDRCRPDFSIKMLEIIKHFFGAGQVHFVLGVNSLALAKAVSHIYGDIDGRKYLMRMIDYVFELPKIDPGSVTDYSEFLDWQLESRIKGRRSGDRAAFGTIYALSNAGVLTARDAERAVKAIAQLRKRSIIGEDGRATLAAALVAMSVSSHDLFDRCRRNTATLTEVLTWLRADREFDEHDQRARIAEIFTSLLGEDEDISKKRMRGAVSMHPYATLGDFAARLRQMG